MLPSRRRRYREHALRMRSLRLPKEACLGILGIFNSGYCSSSSEPERRLLDQVPGGVSLAKKVTNFHVYGCEYCIIPR